MVDLRFPTEPFAREPADGRLRALPDDSAPTDGTSALVPQVDWDRMAECDHFVHFYEEDSFLVRAVGEFFGFGLKGPDVAVAIVTPAHRLAIEQYLMASRFDVAALVADGRLVWLDAGETLARFMREGMPDPMRFGETVGGLVARMKTRGARLRAFGEMVAVLWADGNQDAALRLEELWNDLGDEHSFSLFCAYPLRGFRGEAAAQPFFHVCTRHTRVIPAEGYAFEPSAERRLQCVSILQQKAAMIDAAMDRRKEAEAAAGEQRSKLDLALQIAAVGQWELDLESCSLVASERCRAHFGLPPEARFSYARCLELIHPDDRARVERGLAGSTRHGRDATLEFRVLGPDGKIRWLAAMARAQPNAQGRLLGVTLDITAQKNVAHALEQGVAERTEELRESIAELEAFAYTVSHDLRAPLRSMRGFSEILLQDCAPVLDPDNRANLQRIVNAATRMDRLIRDILAFSHVSHGRFTYESVDLDRLVRGLIEQYAMSRAHFTVVGVLPPVSANPALLTQCLTNLFDNAVKFVAPGTEPRVRIMAQVQPPNGDPARVRIDILDNGIGIAREFHETIFEAFHRLNRTYEGTGIGLSTVKKAVTRMGGRVFVKSEPGHGSMFSLELDLARE